VHTPGFGAAATTHLLLPMSTCTFLVDSIISAQANQEADDKDTVSDVPDMLTVLVSW
jgi:hypothetical protein